MPELRHSIINGEATSFVTFIGPDKPHVAPSTHPNYPQIIKLLAESKVPGSNVDPQEVADLFNVEETIQKRFQRLSERVTVKGGAIYLDGDVQNNALTDQVLRFLNENVTDWEPLVKFYENLLANPDAEARDRLYGFLAAEKFTITKDGLIVGYKSVYTKDAQAYTYRATRNGPAIVDGEENDGGEVIQKIGSVVEMSRSVVINDPHQDCSVGLHVGTWSYANNFKGDKKLEVHVNPRDVVSVPHNERTKMRVCRYTVVREVTSGYSAPVVDGVKLTKLRHGPLPVAEAAVVAPVEPPKAPEAPAPADTPRQDSLDGGGFDIVSKDGRVRYRRPSSEEFDKMVGRAKRRRRNFSKYASKHGPWTFTGNPGDDEKDRLNWTK